MDLGLRKLWSGANGRGGDHLRDHSQGKPKFCTDIPSADDEEC